MYDDQHSTAVVASSALLCHFSLQYHEFRTLMHRLFQTTGAGNLSVSVQTSESTATPRANTLTATVCFSVRPTMLALHFPKAEHEALPSRILIPAHAPSCILYSHTNLLLTDDDSNVLSLPGPVPVKTTWTLLLYLTSAAEGCVGGETVFYPHDRQVASEEIAVPLETGMLLLHKHGDECLLVSDVSYLLCFARGSCFGKWKTNELVA